MNDDFIEEEMAWRKEQGNRDTGREIFETMSYKETEDLLAPIMEERIDKKNYFDKKQKRVKRIVKKTYAPDTFDFDFSVDVIWMLNYMKDDIENQEQLRKLEQYWVLNEARVPKTGKTHQKSREDFSVLITQAKAVEIESLCKNPCRKTGANRFVSLCPFHTEKTPSFTIFTNTNTFYCFGCNAKGDVITFYQKLYGFDFVGAVKSLTGQY